MSTQAEKRAKKPTKALLAIADEVQEVANRSQSFAYRFEDCDDGSRIEIRCAPVPALGGVPDGDADVSGALAIVNGVPVTVYSRAEIDRAAGEVAERVAFCRDALDASDDSQREEIERLVAASESAADALAEKLSAAVETSSHVGVPTDDKTAAFLEELGPGGRAFIAH